MYIIGCVSWVKQKDSRASYNNALQGSAIKDLPVDEFVLFSH